MRRPYFVVKCNSVVDTRYPGNTGFSHGHNSRVQNQRSKITKIFKSGCSARMQQNEVSFDGARRVLTNDTLCPCSVTWLGSKLISDFEPWSRIPTRPSSSKSEFSYDTPFAGQILEVLRSKFSQFVFKLAFSGEKSYRRHLAAQPHRSFVYQDSLETLDQSVAFVQDRNRNKWAPHGQMLPL